MASKPVSLKRRRIMLLTKIAKYKDPECWGRIECAVSAQLIRSMLWEASRDKACPDDLLRLAVDVIPLMDAAAKAPFLDLPKWMLSHNRIGSRTVPNDLMSASSDISILIKAEVIDARGIKPLSYLYSIFIWLQGLLDRGPERGGLAIEKGAAFDQGWDRIAAEIALSADLLPEIERSCQKRARRFLEAFQSYGFFVDPTAPTPAIKVAA